MGLGEHRQETAELAENCQQHQAQQQGENHPQGDDLPCTGRCERHEVQGNNPHSP